MLRSVISELLPKSALPHGLIPYKLYRCLGIIALLAGLAGMASPAWGGGPPPVSNPASPFPLSVLDGNNGFIVTGNEADRIGHALGGGGDVNGDGVPDLLIGTLRGGNKSYLIFGGEPLDAWLNETGDSLPVSTLNGENGFVIHGEEDEDESFGMAVSIIGDINGDGIDDLAVGAPYMPVRDGEDYIWNTGKVYVLFGGNTLNDTGGSLDASALNGVNGFILEGMYDEQSVGFALDAAGDVNGDGMDDWIVGAPSRDGYDEHRSKAYVLFGGDTWNLTGGRFTLDDTTLNGVNGAVIHEIYSIGLGASVSGAGDVNNDGKADLIIGVSGWRHWDGRSYVVFGGETLAAAGGSLNASDLDGANGFLFFDSLVDPDDNVGRLGYSVSKAGDVNGDGIGDLLIGAVNGSIPDDDGEFMRTGKAYLLFGGQWLENEASLDMADLDERHAVEFHGWHYDHAGDSVSAAGDINGDGIDDFLVGASVADSNDWEDLGEAYLIYGAPVLDASINLVTLNNNEIDGVRFTEIAHDYEDGSYYNNTVSAAGDLNADGAPDFLIGTPLFNYSDEEGAVYIIFGNASPGQSGFPQVLAAIPANTFNPPGDSVHNLFYERYIDPDQDQFAGIAIVDNAAFPMREGQWEYSVDSGAWTAVGTVSDNAAIVLGPNDRVRFVPIADYFGTPGMLAVRLWDGWGGFSRGSGNNIHGHIGGLNGFSNDKNQVKLKTQITEGSPPQLDIINPLSLTKDASFSYTAGVNDPDTPAADLRFGLDNAPSGAGIGAETGVFTWTPATTGIFSFSVRVTDDTSLSDTTPILINVNAPPRPKPGRIRFLSSSYSVSEQAGYIDISVIRQKYSTGSISVDYDVDAGGGADKDDYLLEAGTLDWASGETGAKTFRITILPDDLPESDETLFLRLHNVRGPGDAILTDHTAVLTIQGDAMNRCTSPIESYCHAGGQTFDGLKISPAGVVAQAILTGSVANEGRITDSTLAAGSRLNGGTLGGIIINHGDLSDFLFIGERLDGGGLSGNIRVAGGETGGILQNIALAGGARISGGRLAGSVTGDPKAPALVTDAAVLAGAQLAHLILGEGVELADGIFFGEGVYPQIGFAAEEYLATENQDHITISVVRTVSTGKSVSAAYRSAEIDDDDAPFVSGVFTWNSDDDNLDKTFSVPAKIDNLPHGMETLTLMLGDIDDAALMPGHSAAILHVRSKLSPETITLLDALGAEFITMEVENPECNLENIAADAEEIQLKLLHVELACDEPNITLFYHKINSMTDSVYRQYGPAARGGMMPEVVFRTVTRDDGRILTTARVTLKDGEASDDTAADWHDVQLAADARINGGILQGAVVGDKDAPALLENVILRTETYLENVIIGDNVKFGPGVTFGPNVRLAARPCAIGSKSSPEAITLLDALGEGFITMEVENPECNLGNIAAETEENQSGLLNAELACDEPNITLFYNKINSMTDSVYREYGPATPNAPGCAMPEAVFRTVARDDGRILTTARVTLKDGEANDDTAADWHDVQLAADARIDGGILQGAVVGDKDAPALLENVILRTETYLENVIIGDNVKFGPGVTFGPNVRLATHPDCTAGSKKYNALWEQIGESGSCISGALAIDGETMPNHTMLTYTQAESVDIKIKMWVEPAHVDKAADLFVLLTYTDLKTESFYTLDSQTWKSMDPRFDAPKAMRSYEHLPAIAELPLFNGSLIHGPGEYAFYMGYRLKNGGAVITNLEEPVHFHVGNSLHAGTQSAAAHFEPWVINERGLNESFLENTAVGTQLRVDAKHVGQAANLLMMALHKRRSEEVLYILYGEEWREWNASMGFPPAQRIAQLPEILDISVPANIWRSSPRELLIFAGYQLADGSIIYNGRSPMHLAFAGGTNGTDETLARFATWIHNDNHPVNFRSDPGVSLVTNIAVDPRHIGQTADILLVATYRDSLMHSGRARKWGGWDENSVAFSNTLSHVVLKDILYDLPVYTGSPANKKGAGNYVVYIGYRLSNGTIIYNGGETMDLGAH